MPSAEHPYTGTVFLRGGPRDGQYQHVDDFDLSLGLGYHEEPRGMYRPLDETQESPDGPVPVLEFERAAF